MALTATRRGPLQIWTPTFATLNVEALALAALAAALLFGLRSGIATTSSFNAGAALVWSLLAGAI